MEGFMIAGVILIAVGAMFLILAILFLTNKSHKKRYSAKTIGRVTDMCKSAQSFNSGGDGEGAHFGVYVTGSADRSKHNRCPVFTYNVNRTEYTKADGTAYDTDMIKRMMNKNIDVYYNPLNPADATLSAKNPLMIVGFVFAGISILLIGLGIAFIASC